MPEAEAKILRLAQRKGVLRARDLSPLGIPRRHLADLTERGLLVRSGRGLYTPADMEPSESHSLAEAAARVPGGVVCLLSALRFHGLTTQNPWQGWPPWAAHRPCPPPAAPRWPPARRSASSASQAKRSRPASSGTASTASWCPSTRPQRPWP